MAEQAGRTPWQQRFEGLARRQFPARVARACAEPESYRRPGNTAALAVLVRAAALYADEIPDQHLDALIRLAFRPLLIVGTDRAFREHQDFFQAILDLIEVLDRRAAAVSGHFLDAARFAASVATLGQSRAELISRAVATARTVTETITARHYQARVRVDASDYRGAHRLLTRLEQEFDPVELRPHLAEHECARGLADFYNDTEVARAHFESAIRAGTVDNVDPGAGQSVATATHFLGRLAATRGQYGTAIDLYRQAEELSDAYTAGHGYYHQRIAEILVSHGEPRDARYHLDQAGAAFSTVRDISSGQALLDQIWARWYVRAGAVDAAEATLRSALELVPRHGIPRIELVLSIELVRVLHRSGRRRGIAALVPRLIRLGAGEVVDAGVIGIARKLVTALRLLRPAAAVPTDRPVPCPCGADHRPAGPDPGRERATTDADSDRGP